MDKKTLLLIENSENDAIIIAQYLDASEVFEFETIHVQTLKEAEHFLQKLELDIVLVNLHLPDSFGIHTFDNLFRKYPQYPFLILTDINDDMIGMNAVNRGAQDFLVKDKIDTYVLSRSITYAIERKKTEEYLKRSEERYRTLFKRSKDAIYISTDEGNFVDINPAGIALFGYTIEDLSELNVRDLYVDQTDRDRLKHELEINGQVSDFEVQLLKKDGVTKMYCLLSSIAIFNKDKEVIGYQGIIRDITEKKKAEKALFKSLTDLDHANKELQYLNTHLEEKIADRTKELVKEKTLVEIHHKEIKESIQYAKRIQASILPPQKRIRQGFLDSFVYYEPKDVVSGDFYWFEKINKKSLFAVVDCTGHGVPGAFMSIIGYTQLNEIVNQQKLTDPGVILRELDKRVNSALHQNTAPEKNSKDGMELGLITVDYEQQKLEFAGAMRPLYLVRDGELTAYRGSRFSIGGTSRRVKEFETLRIPFQKGDSFFLFTDGYPDQFGGPNGKKFMTKNVIHMLRGIAHLPITEQQKVIKRTIKEWMGEEEQTDDILLSGIQF